MLIKRLAALALAGAMMLGHAAAQTSPGTSPLSGAKGGTGNAFMQFTGPASSLKTYTLPNASDTIATLGAIQTNTAAKTFNNNTLKLAGAVSGVGTLLAPSAASTYFWTLPAATGTLAYTGNNLSAFAATTSAQLAGVLSDETGSGPAVFGTAPTITNGNLVTPVIGVATGTSLYLNTGGTGASPFPFYATGNNGGAFPTLARGLAVGTNLSNGQSEIDFVNTNSTAAGPDAFRWYFQTGASALTQVMSVTKTGDLGITSGTFATGANTNAVINRWTADGRYNALSLNGDLTSAGMIGLFAGMSTDAYMYFGVPTGGAYQWRVNNTNVGTLSANGLAIPGVITGASHYFGGAGSSIRESANGVLALYNAAGTDFGRLQFGGTTSSFPALKRSSADLQVRLADDSAYTGLYAGTLITQSSLFFGSSGSISPSSDGVLRLFNAAGTDFNRLQFGGTSASFPAIKRNGADVNVRLADDSDYAGLAAKYIYGDNLTASRLVATNGSKVLSSTITSANMAASISDETGTGAAVFGTGPTMSALTLSDLTASSFAATDASKKIVSLTNTAATAQLNTMVGDSGSGGTKGLVPLPGAGDAAAGKFLKADGTWAVPAGGGGGGGMTDTERQNFALNLIYQAKAFGGYRRVINQFADGFAATDGVNTGSSTNYSVDTTNKRVVPTTAGGSDATGSGTALSGGDQSGFGPSRAFDNNNATDWESLQLGPSGQNGVAYVGYDFGSGITKNITSATIKQGGTGLSVSSVLVQYSDNGSAWTTASTWSGLPADTTVQSNSFSSVGSHRYWRLLANANVSGSGNAWVVYEVEFIEPGTTNNMTLVTTAQTADATVSNGRVLIEYNPIDAITLNTHLTAEVTCNGGMNWASATLSNAGTGQAGRAVAETADTACTSGTSFAARIKSLNNKNLQIYGTSLTVH